MRFVEGYLGTINALRLGDDVPTAWYFADPAQFEEAVSLCIDTPGVYIETHVTHFGDHIPDDDFITDAFEMRPWLTGEEL